MDKFSFVFLVREDGSWEQVFSHADNLLKSRNKVENIAVVAIGTALLSCLKRTNMSALKENITRLAGENVKFYLCANTMHRYGVDEDMLLPQIKVAHEGGLIKVAEFSSLGYHLITMG
ncbi:DsrE family protein [Bacteroides sp.]|uniref:DsrE family protein n=1 Tax=Bacteroides sp. TaxID=29523 RepID=UPI003A94C085